MAATKRQIEAARRNGARSAGPRTEAGKRIAARNSLRHGLAGEGLDVPDHLAEQVERRKAEWAGEFGALAGRKLWLYNVAVTESVRHDAALEHLLTLGEVEARAAELDWHGDRRLEALDLFARIGRDPARVVAALRRTLQGAELLIERWEGLADAQEAKGGWTMEQLHMAHNLLGLPLEFRHQPSALDPEPGQTPQEACRAAVAEQLAELRRLVAEVLEERDELERVAAMRGEPLNESKAVARVRRYANASLRRMTWALEELRRDEPEPAEESPREGTERPATPAPAPAAPPRAPRPEAPSAAPAPRIEGAAPARRPDLDKLRKKWKKGLK